MDFRSDIGRNSEEDMMAGIFWALGVEGDCICVATSRAVQDEEDQLECLGRVTS